MRCLSRLSELLDGQDLASNSIFLSLFLGIRSVGKYIFETVPYTTHCFLRYIINVVMSAGETPEILEACPRERGLMVDSFSWASFLRPLICLKSKLSGIIFPSSLSVFPTVSRSL